MSPRDDGSLGVPRSSYAPPLPPDPDRSRAAAPATGVGVGGSPPRPAALLIGSGNGSGPRRNRWPRHRRGSSSRPRHTQPPKIGRSHFGAQGQPSAQTPVRDVVLHDPRRPRAGRWPQRLPSALFGEPRAAAGGGNLSAREALSPRQPQTASPRFSLKQRPLLTQIGLSILLLCPGPLSEVLHPSFRARRGRPRPPAHGEFCDGVRGANRLRGLTRGHKTVRAHRSPVFEPG
jgi:hypothetical protein